MEERAGMKEICLFVPDFPEINSLDFAGKPRTFFLAAWKSQMWKVPEKRAGMKEICIFVPDFLLGCPYFSSLDSRKIKAAIPAVSVFRAIYPADM